MIKNILIKLIKVYQSIPGEWHASCKYFPTCSNYGIEALEKHGAIKGGILTFVRLLRCNPWAKGGYYPVPEKFTLKVKHIDENNAKEE